MKRRKMNIPTSVSALLISDSTEMKRSSNFSSSIIHQVSPSPALGTAR